MNCHSQPNATHMRLEWDSGTSINAFLATNILKWSRFEREQRPITVQGLVDAYNRIVSENETDPSLQISMA